MVYTECTISTDEYFQLSFVDMCTILVQSADLNCCKGTKVKTLGGRAVAGAWLVAWAIMAMGAIINTHAHR